MSDTTTPTSVETPLDKIARERTQGIVTYSGRTVLRGAVGDVPALGDIALGLSRMPRFAGQTRQFWSVLDHTLFMVELARTANGSSPFNFRVPIDDDARRWLMRLALFHDAHEAITADIPSTFKSSDMKYEQSLLDARLFARYNVPTQVTSFNDVIDLHPLVANLDHVALLAEARLVGSPLFNNDAAVKKHFHDYPSGVAVSLLNTLLDHGVVGGGPVLYDADVHDGYRQFINHFINLA